MPSSTSTNGARNASRRDQAASPIPVRASTVASITSGRSTTAIAENPVSGTSSHGWTANTELDRTPSQPRNRKAWRNSETIGFSEVSMPSAGTIIGTLARIVRGRRPVVTVANSIRAARSPTS
jgi:hypothetical protein